MTRESLHRQGKQNGRKKSHIVRRIILIIVGILLLSGVAVGAVTYYKMNRTISKMQKPSATTKKADQVTASKAPVSYLLLTKTNDKFLAPVCLKAFTAFAKSLSDLNSTDLLLNLPLCFAAISFIIAFA